MAPQCFTCAGPCGKSLLDDKPHVGNVVGTHDKSQKPFCHGCYRELFLPRCAVCGEPVEGRYFMCEDKYHRRHPDCFEKIDYCAVCEEPIRGTYMDCESTRRRRHPDCFIEFCALCGKGLNVYSSRETAVGEIKYCRKGHEGVPSCQGCGRQVLVIVQWVNTAEALVWRCITPLYALPEWDVVEALVIMQLAKMAEAFLARNNTPPATSPNSQNSSRRWLARSAASFSQLWRGCCGEAGAHSIPLSSPCLPRKRRRSLGARACAGK
jgi:hypothetical protein